MPTNVQPGDAHVRRIAIAKQGLVKLLDKLTPVSAIELSAALAAVLPNPKVRDIALAHWALETGWGKSCHCYNLGNVKATEGWCSVPGNDWTFYRCNEVLGGRVVWYDPPNVACRFRAFRSLAAGAADWLYCLQHDFPKSWDAMQKGDPALYVTELKQEGYFTAPLETYSATFLAVLKMIETKTETPETWYQTADGKAWLEALKIRKYGESPGGHIARVLESCVGISLHNQPEKLYALASIDNPLDPVAWAKLVTNCATTCRWIFAICGCRSTYITRHDTSGMSMSWVLEAARELGALVPGMQWAILDRGWYCHYGTPGVNNDHLEGILSKPTTFGVAKHAGGGRADNAITAGEGDIRFSLGRPEVNIVDPAKMCPVPLLQEPPPAPPPAPPSPEPDPVPAIPQPAPEPPTKAPGGVPAPSAVGILAVLVGVALAISEAVRACLHIP